MHKSSGCQAVVFENGDFALAVEAFFIPLPDEVGRGVLASPRMSGRPSVRPASGCPHFVSEQNSVTRAWISLIFDTHIP